MGWAMPYIFWCQNGDCKKNQICVVALELSLEPASRCCRYKNKIFINRKIHKQHLKHFKDGINKDTFQHPPRIVFSLSNEFPLKWTQCLRSVIGIDQAWRHTTHPHLQGLSCEETALPSGTFMPHAAKQGIAEGVNLSLPSIVEKQPCH